ncbi:hypothetical protein [Streptomyces sp. NPDC057540]|uniref:hypothetical protein n=1 Tax=Streptomyces sp. NPDC057540 TaxID=3346160 RepID=UPI0036A0411E
MSIRARIGMFVGIVCTALMSLIAAPGAAFAATCSNYGCDGINPDNLNWNGTSVTRLGPATNGNGVTVELRSGTYNGKVYVWGRMQYAPASNEHLTYISVDRCTADRLQCTYNMGSHAGGTSGWSGQLATNTWATWTGVYYDSALISRACVYDSSNGRQFCTGWW